MKTFWNTNNLDRTEIGGYPLKKIILSALVLNLIVGMLAFLIQPLLPPQIPLFYGMAEAEKVIAPAWGLIIPTLISMGILSVNFLLSIAFEDLFIKKTLLLSGIAASFFAIVTTLKIFFLVASF